MSWIINYLFVWRDVFTCCVCAGITFRNSETKRFRTKSSGKTKCELYAAPFLSDETEAELKGNHHFFSRNQNYVNIQDVPKLMSQTSPGYSPPLIKQKCSYQHGSKSEQVPRYPLTFMCGYPLRYYIRCSKCWPFAATHPFRCRIMGSLTRSSWPGRFLITPNVATMRSHNSWTLVTGVE
jgi:hypothetical protein